MVQLGQGAEHRRVRGPGAVQRDEVPIGGAVVLLHHAAAHHRLHERRVLEQIGEVGGDALFGVGKYVQADDDGPVGHQIRRGLDLVPAA
ncbi:MAG: hypothetical protein V9E94_13190 [Microthrixaceae bacterium]